MRVLFLLFVLANLAFYAWTALVAPGDSTADSRPLRAQVEPDRIRILPRDPGEAPLPATKPSPAPAGAPAAGAPAAGACLEWGSFTNADLPAAERALEPLALGARLAQRRAEEAAGWWVYMPPQGNRQNAQKKTTELKGLGIDDWFIVQEEGRWRWAVSLGVFRTEEAARNRLEALRARGVRTAQLGERELLATKVWLQGRNVEPALAARWRELAQGFAGTELRDCAK